MSKLGISRTILFIVGLLGVLAFSSTSAFASGKPTVTTLGASNSQLTSQTLNGTVKPNELETTYKFEYGPTEALGTSTSEVGIGSGTEAVPVSKELVGLFPNTDTYYRVVATNKKGTTFGVIWRQSTLRWTSAGAKKPWAEFPATYASKGSFNIEFQGFNESLKCNENGYGTIGNPGGIGDEINVTLTGCVLYSESKELCKLTESTGWSLGGNFRAFGPILTTIQFPPECNFIGGTNVEIQNVADFSPRVLGNQVENPVTFSGQSKFGLHNVPITGTSTWSLTGVNSGRRFYVE